ncbi:hypothetical protein LEP1GSC062_4181 [Leptospira alexanderi serovar Manhao 3 str. L 60]|uniref:Uncharacterized protein n=1 Tax=Leptospira alexanderi serovar Manhao 3 str. L 60 TaxID=1049759 RepID=V6ICM3_9LEPT|nr:hypothetical protein LEP1GSC062_4181 [Leptospira alexanderi serovar Manhao 3 str. L 60]
MNGTGKTNFPKKSGGVPTISKIPKIHTFFRTLLQRPSLSKNNSKIFERGNHERTKSRFQGSEFYGD